MLRSLDSSISALQQFQQQMDVIGNNIANVDTTGFKSAQTGFEDTFSQTLQGGASGSMQIGTGVNTSAIVNRFSQGTITNTGVQTDLAINGNGFFLVRDAASGSQYASRDGSFQLDANGYLINSQGLRVQGFADAGLTARGDIQIDATGAPASAAPGATVASFSIGPDGKITVRLTDGTQFTRGQVLLQNFANPQALSKSGDNLYSGLTAAGPLAQSQAPGSGSLGGLQAGALEMSNVDLTNEMASLITAQRAFEASSRVVITSDQILQDVVGMKR